MVEMVVVVEAEELQVDWGRAQGLAEDLLGREVKEAEVMAAG